MALLDQWRDEWGCIGQQRCRFISGGTGTWSCEAATWCFWVSTPIPAALPSTRSYVAELWRCVRSTSMSSQRTARKSSSSRKFQSEVMPYEMISSDIEEVALGVLRIASLRRTCTQSGKVARAKRGEGVMPAMRAADNLQIPPPKGFKVNAGKIGYSTTPTSMPRLLS